MAAEPAIFGGMILQDVTFTLAGAADLLMHSPQHMERTEDTGMVSTKKALLSEQDEAEQGAYRNHGGELVLPSIHVRMAILDTSTKFKPKGVVMGTMKQLVVASLHMVERTFPLLDADAKPITDYIIDKQPVRRGKGTVVACRPLVQMPWYLQCHFWLDMERMKPEDLKKILITAGLMNGLGEFRPQKGGWYGRFQVVQFAVAGEEV